MIVRKVRKAKGTKEQRKGSGREMSGVYGWVKNGLLQDCHRVNRRGIGKRRVGR
jgi:hypothetical protein